MIFLFDGNEDLQGILDQTSDVWDVEVYETMEGLFTFEFKMSAYTDLAKQIESNWLVGIEDLDGKNQLFVIKEIVEEHEDDMVTTVFCEHAITELLDQIIENEFIDRKLDRDAIETILLNTNWTVGTVEEGTDRHTYTIKYENVLEALKTYSKRWGNELAYEVEFIGTSIARRIVHVYQQRGNETGKRFDFDRNVERVRRAVDGSNLKTAMFGTAKAETQDENEATDTEIVTFENVLWSTDPVTTNLLESRVANAEEGTSGFSYYLSGGGSISLVSDTTTSMFGTTSLKVTHEDIDPKTMSMHHRTYSAPIEPYKTYTASVYAKNDKAGGENMSIAVYARDASGAYTETYSGSNVHIFNEWTRLELTFTPPANTVDCFMLLRLLNAENGNSMWWDGAQVEEQPEATPWIDGGVTRSWGGKPVNKPIGQNWVGSEDAREKYGRLVNGTRTHKFGVFDYGGSMTPEELLEETWNQLEGVLEPLVQYEVSAIDLQRITGLNPLEVRIGDVVNVIDHELDMKVKARIIERSGDLFEPEVFNFRLGNFMPFFSNQIDQITNSIRDTQDLLDEKVTRGETIATHWLETEIELLNNMIRAGQGTVTMTEDNGILITDTRDNPTKALRLLGGIFAIANSKNADGTWAWSTFGTGDGFSAEHINTETMRFDRLQGGKLKLGGAIDGYYENGQPVFTNGILEVYDQEGNLSVELTGDNRGFDFLHVNELNAPNVVSKTMNTTEKTYYVDVVNGQDGNEGTEASPFRTISGALNHIPKYITEDIIVQVVNTDTYWKENVEVRGYHGNGRLRLYFGYRNTMQGHVFCEHCSCTVWVSTDGTPLNHTDRANIDGWDTEETTSVVRGDVCSYLFVYGIKVGAPTALAEGLTVNYGIANFFGFLRVTRCEVHDVSNTCIGGALYGGQALIGDVSGLAPYGIKAIGGLVVVDGYTPHGETSHKYTSSGGQIFGTSTTSSGVATPAKAPRTTDTYNPTESHSYRDFSNGWEDDWRTDGDAIYQGEWEYYGNHKGVMLFDQTAIKNALTNTDGTKRTVVSARLKLTRFDSGGSSAKGYPTFWTTNATAIGGTAPEPSVFNSWTSSVGWAWGETLWVNIPTTMIDAIYNGHTGLVTHVADGSPYMRWYGATHTNRPVLEITHE